jgi:hypothetical protein
VNGYYSSVSAAQKCTFERGREGGGGGERGEGGEEERERGREKRKKNETLVNKRR